MAEGPWGRGRLQGLTCVFAPSKQSRHICLAPWFISIVLGISDPLLSVLAVQVVLVVTVIHVLDGAVAQLTESVAHGW